MILAPDGSPRGELQLPPDVRPLWSHDDSLIGVDFDEFDVPWIVRYWILPG